MRRAPFEKDLVAWPTPWHVTPCHATPCHVTPCHVTPWRRRLAQRTIVVIEGGARIVKGGARRAQAREADAHGVLPLGIVVRHLVPRSSFSKLTHGRQQPLAIVHNGGHGKGAPHKARAQSHAVAGVA